MTSSPGSAEFEAWGGRMLVLTTDPAMTASALDAVRRVVDDVDVACSSFRGDSELARVVASAGTPVAVSPLLLDAIEAAIRAARLTDGDVDPTVGEALVAFGFTPPLGGEAPAAASGGLRIARVPGYEAIALDRVAGTVRVPRGVRLDLGATAKALAADLAATAAHAAAGCGVLVSLAGDMAVAGAAPEGGWRIRVTDDHRSGVEAPGQWIALHSGGLATSSTVPRARGEAHHVIDPRTGRPAAVHFRTVSVAAASCLDANIASTASIVRGERAVPWLESLRLPGRLVTAAGTVVHVAGWPTDSEDARSAGAELPGGAKPADAGSVGSSAGAELPGGAR